MNSEKLKDVFTEVQIRLELPQYLVAICSDIIIGNTSLDTIDKVLAEQRINHSIAKIDFLHLIFEYIKIALEDNILTNDEKENINYLKRLFKIKAGDFYLHAKGQLEGVISYHLSKIYNDNFVTTEEALLKIDIQELFDLSFDQMNEYTKIKAAVSIRQGASPEDLDVFFTHSEYFKLKR